MMQRRYLAPILFLCYSILAQFVGFNAGIYLRESGPFWIPMAAHALIAFCITWILGLPISWRILNAAIPILLLLSTEVSPPSWLIGGAAILLAIIYLPTFWTRVPYYPTRDEMYELVLQLLPTDQEFRLLDIGCGFGRLLTFLSNRRDKGSFTGVEIGLLPYLVTKIRSLFSPRITARLKNFWGLNLSDYDYVYAFLAPGPMPELWEKVKREMRPGSIFISNTFEVPHPADEVIEIDDSRQGRLFIYRL